MGGFSGRNGLDMKRVKITEEQAEEMYCEMLDELYPIQFGDMSYLGSVTLEKIDSIAYRVGLSDYIDSIRDEYEVDGYE